MNNKLRAAIESVNSILTDEVSTIDNLNAGLLTDLGGSCMFFFYYAKVFNDEIAYEKGYSLLERIITLINYISDGSQFSFCNGLAGIGWMIDHLEKKDFIDFDESDVLLDFDQKLSKYIFKELNVGNYDFLHGAMGVVYYYIQRNNKANNKVLLEAIEILDRIKSTNKWGIFWVFFNGLSYSKEIDIANLGLSHGIPSIITLLAKFNLVNPDKKTTKLIETSIDFILKTENKETNHSLYPYTYNLNAPTDENSRLGWCYGDTGIALALLTAAKSLGNENYKERAIQIMEHASMRKSLIENQIVDAGLCHGTAGIAQMFRKFYFETGSIDFLNCSNFWIDKTIELIEPRSNLITGMVKWDSKLGYVNCYGMLEGLSGVGLALLSAISDVPLFWDEALLIS